MQGGSGGAGGNGGAGGSSAGGTPGLGGSAGEGGLGGQPGGSNGPPGVDGSPGGQLVKPVVPKPTAAPTPAPPVSTTLTGVLIQAVSNDTQTKDCIANDVFSAKGRTNSIGGGKIQISLLLPGKNAAPLAGLTTNTYDTKTLTLAGIPAQTKTSGVTIAGLPYLVVDFNDDKDTFSKLGGTSVTLKGTYAPTGGPAVAYSASLKVCA